MIRYIVKWKTLLMAHSAEIGPFEDRKSAEIVEKGLLSSDHPMDVKIEEIRYEFWVDCFFHDGHKFRCGPFTSGATATTAMMALRKELRMSSSWISHSPIKSQ